MGAHSRREGGEYFLRLHRRTAGSLTGKNRMNENARVALLPFLLDGHTCAVPVDTVARVIPLVEITPLPDAPPCVHGIINVAGAVVPVFDMKTRFGLPGGEFALTQVIVIAAIPGRQVGFVADEVLGIMHCRERELVPAGELLPGFGKIHGAARTAEGVIVISNLARFLRDDEAARLEEALAAAPPSQADAPGLAG